LCLGGAAAGEARLHLAAKEAERFFKKPPVCGDLVLGTGSYRLVETPGDDFVT
jgi:hypothetical protein